MKILLRYIARYVAVVVVLAAAGIGIWWLLQRGKEPEVIAFRATPGQTASMARLCSVEIYNEATLVDTINSKMLFAIQKQRGRISFDVDSLDMRERGDTLIVSLPKERVDLYEDTEDGSWQVIDSKNVAPLGFLLPDRLSLAEENALKRRFRRKSVAKLYANGVVARARREAAENLEQMLGTLYRRPVIVEY